MGQSVKRGAMATGGAQIVKLGCQITSVIVLSRLLQPDDFGIVAMAAPVAAFVGLFLDMGLTQATVQKKSITAAEVNSLFWINMAVSAVLGVIMILISPLVARFYGEPQVALLVAVMSLQLLVVGLGAQHSALVTRRMAFGRLALLESVGALLGLATAIAWAYFERTYWALFVGGMTTMVFMTLGCWISSHWRPGVPRWASGTKDMVRFGAGLTGFNFANFFGRNIDQILIGRHWGNQQLGLYDRANRLLLFPLQQVIYPLGKVMVPALSRLSHEPERYRKAYLRVAPLLLFVAVPGVAVAIATADFLIPLALGDQWEGSVRIFQALGFAGMLQPLNSPAGWLFISQGRSGDFMKWGIFGAITISVSVVLGLPYGAIGVAVSYAVHEYLRTPVLWLYVGRSGPVQAGHILRMAAPFVLGAHVAVGVLWLLKSHLPGEPIMALILATVLSYLIVAAIAALFAAGRDTLMEVHALASKGLITRLRTGKA
ncbi:lipopolysaccharide biosynthesis protein [Falsirhodobacter sp. 1013]|uniref:lipopolysaccharide biosynthesis protein n=1 Tax=Falsirhodobacter sp. 1013 TaxID=3417566 RepID=UPI003EBE5F01